MKNKRHTTKFKITSESEAVTKRARQIVERLTKDGHDVVDISRLTDSTVMSLINGGSPKLRRPQLNALAIHYNVSLLWLATGLGPEFITPSQQNFKIS